jgi:hypothetical protein
MKSLIAVAARRVIVDTADNHVSVIDVIEAFRAQTFPIIVPNLTVLFYIKKELSEPSNLNLSLKCRVNNAEIFSSPVAVDFQQGNLTRVIVAFKGFVIPSDGMLWIELRNGDNEIGAVQVPVETLELSKSQAEVGGGAKFPD